MEIKTRIVRSSGFTFGHFIMISPSTSYLFTVDKVDSIYILWK